MQNKGNEGSLRLGKVYKVIRPLKNDPRERIRVVDEEAEDYLYPKDWFEFVVAKPASRKRVLSVIS